MDRKKSQILYNFLPEDTFDHAQNNAIGRVSEIFDDEDADPDLPINYILDRIRPQLDGWEAAPEFSVRSTELKVPGDVAFELFPLNFRCPSCEVVNTVDRSAVRNFGTHEGDRSIAYCNSCGHALQDSDQQQLVMVCRCGNLESLWVPSHCDDRGTMLQRRGSGLGAAYWVCDCGHIIDRLLETIPDCFDCDRTGDEREVKVHSASTTFYPQTESFVNISQASIGRLRDSEEFCRQTVVDYLVEDDPREIGADDGSLSDEARDILSGLDDNLRDQVMTNLEEEEAAIEQRREDAVEFIESQFGDRQLLRLSEEVYEYRQIYDEDVDHLNLQQLYEDAQNQQNLNRGRLGQYQDRRDDLNLDEVRLMRNFPVTSVVYGYSRLSHVPEEGAALRAFEGGYGSTLYSLTSSAEAIAISLDRRAVLRWVASNVEAIQWDGVVDSNPEEDIERWLLGSLSPVDEGAPVYPYNSDIPEDDPVRRHVLTLLHTLSHLVINAIDSLSGYSRESLVEYTLLRTLTFVVYKRSDTDFSLGALFSLVENNFIELCEYLVEEEQNCMYDPVCAREEGGSCEGCLYISALSCQHQNCNLSRATVFGGEFSGEDITGFFDIDA